MKKLFRRSIKIKKTKYFYISLFLIAVLFAAGFVHNNNLAYITMFFVFSISLISVVLGRLNIIKADVDFFARGFAGENTKISANVKRGEEIDYFPKEYVFKKRGINKLDMAIVSEYPLFLVKFMKKKECEFLIYPALRGRSLRELISKKDDIDFEKIKPYSEEALKYIHWPSLAKGDLQVKVFEGDKASYKMKFDYSKIAGDKEAKISQLTLWAYEAFNEGVEFEIVLPDAKIKSKEGYERVFEKLALY